MDINKQIMDLVAEKYKNFIGLANSLTKNKDNSYELVHLTMLQLVERENKKTLKKVIDENQFFVYFFVCMKQQYMFKNSEYNKTVQKQNVNEPILLTEEEVDEDNIEEKVEFEAKMDVIEKIVNSELLSWYQRELFKLYYFSGKTSLRKLEKLTGINFVSIQKTIKETVIIIKNQIKNGN